MNSSYKMLKNAHIKDLEDYNQQYKYSIESSEKFWDEKAKRLSWFKKWNKTKDVDFLTGKIEWFIEGEINASYNCIDRHIENGFGDETAIIWEGNDPSQSRKFTYNKLLKEVSQFANALKDLGVNKGDRVCLYMQMILSTTRIKKTW